MVKKQMRKRNKDVWGRGYAPAYDNCFIRCAELLTCIDNVVAIHSDCGDAVAFRFVK